MNEIEMKLERRVRVFDKNGGSEGPYLTDTGFLLEAGEEISFVFGGLARYNEETVHLYKIVKSGHPTWTNERFLLVGEIDCSLPEPQRPKRTGL